MNFCLQPRLELRTFCAVTEYDDHFATAPAPVLMIYCILWICQILCRAIPFYTVPQKKVMLLKICLPNLADWFYLSNITLLVHVRTGAKLVLTKRQLRRKLVFTISIAPDFHGRDKNFFTHLSFLLFVLSSYLTTWSEGEADSNLSRPLWTIPQFFSTNIFLAIFMTMGKHSFKKKFGMI